MSDERSLHGTQIPTKRRWIVFGLAAATSFMLYLHRYTWNFIRPELMDEYKFSNQEMGILDTAFYASYSLGQIPGGIICDMFGPHLFVGIIIAVWSLTMPCLGMASSMNGLIAARLGFGAAQAGCYPAIAKVTREWFPISQRTTLQGLVASFFGRSGGAMSSLFYGSFLMGICGFSWRVALTMLALLGLALAVLFLWQCRNRPEEDPRCNEAEQDLIRAGDATPVDDQPKVLPLSRALKNASLRMFVVQQYMNAGADYVYSILMGSFFIESRGVTDKVILGILASMPLWGGACGGVAGGMLNDFLIRVTGSRSRSRTIVGFSGKVLACFFLYAALMYPNVPLVPSLVAILDGVFASAGILTALGVDGISDPLAAAGLLFLTKFFTDWTQPTVWGTSTDMGGRYSATVFSVINASGGVGGVITPMVGGWLLDRYATVAIENGEKITTTHYEPVFVMVGVMYLLSAVCWLFINSENSLDRAAPSKGQLASDEAEPDEPV
ncbi:MAG: MFS transporter [Rhodopirellula sp.]|nr:MFS transporter [Rhodopirellula sp.]